MNSARKIIIAILVLIIIAILIWVIYDNQKPETLDTNRTQNIVRNPNEGFSNLINQVMESGNTAKGSLEEKEEEKEEEIKPPTTSNSSEVLQEQTVDKEEKAKELAAKEWGDMEGFYLAVEGIDPEGRYRITVRDNQTARVATYIVDVDTEKVTEQ